MHTHSEAHPFRDGTAGTEAKRRKLLSDRRDDLATMNHEIRRVYVARASALSAHLALFAGGALLVLASYSPGLAARVSGLMPGDAPAPLSTLLLATWVVAALGYLGGRALAEHRFNVAMSRAVLPTDDLHVDVARLSHEAPDSVGRRMARRLETPSRLGSLLALGLVMPATLLVALLFAEAAGYPKVDTLEYHLVGESTSLFAIALLALINALWIGFRPNLRSHSLLALDIAACAVVAFARPYVLFALLPAALILAAVHASKARAHRRQNARIDQEGAPLPPVFSVRKRIAAITRAVKTLPAHCTLANLRRARTRAGHTLRSIRSYRPGRAQMVSAALLLSGAAAIAFALAPTSDAQASASAASNIDNLEEPAAPALLQSSAHIIDEMGPGVLIDLNFVNGLPIDATSILGGVAIPSGWQATVTVTRESGDGAFFVQAFPTDSQNPSPRQLSESAPTVTIWQANCGPFDVPLELHVSPYGDWAVAGSAKLRYQVQMELVGCSAPEGDEA